MPTFLPSVKVSYDEAVVQEVTVTENYDENKPSKGSNSLWDKLLYFVIGWILLMFICVIGCILLLKMRHKHKDRNKEKKKAFSNSTDIITIDSRSVSPRIVAVNTSNINWTGSFQLDEEINKLKQQLIAEKAVVQQTHANKMDTGRKMNDRNAKLRSEKSNCQRLQNELNETKQLLQKEKTKTNRLQKKMKEMSAAQSRKIHKKGNKTGWKQKKIDKWSNGDILHWINSMNLEIKWNNKLFQEIKNCECTGKDIVYLKSAEEVGESFDIAENQSLCNILCRNIKNLKKQNDTSSKPMNNKFKINIISQGKDITLNQMVAKTVRVRDIKKLYKQQSGVAAPLDDIHFYCKMKLLQDWKTLEQVNIVDDKHLITVKFGADSADTNSSPNSISSASVCVVCNKCYGGTKGNEFVYHCNANKITAHESRANIAEDKPLCIAKAVDSVLGHKYLYQKPKTKKRASKKKRIQKFISDPTKMSKRVNKIKWHKVPQHVITKKNKSIKLQLHITKMELIKSLKQFISDATNNKLIQVLVGSNKRQPSYEYVWIVRLALDKLEQDIHIGISVKYNDKLNDPLQFTAIYLDKESILKRHKLAVPSSHECHCLDDVTFGISNLIIHGQGISKHDESIIIANNEESLDTQSDITNITQNSFNSVNVPPSNITNIDNASTVTQFTAEYPIKSATQMTPYNTASFNQQTAPLIPYYPLLLSFPPLPIAANTTLPLLNPYIYNTYYPTIQLPTSGYIQFPTSNQRLPRLQFPLLSHPRICVS